MARQDSKSRRQLAKRAQQLHAQFEALARKANDLQIDLTECPDLSSLPDHVIDSAQNVVEKAWTTVRGASYLVWCFSDDEVKVHSEEE